MALNTNTVLWFTMKLIFTRVSEDMWISEVPWTEYRKLFRRETWGFSLFRFASFSIREGSQLCLDTASDCG